MRWCMGRRATVGCWALAVIFLCGCGISERGVGSTADGRYTLTLEVVDGTVFIGDQTPIVVQLKRTDNSNLEKGMAGHVVITLSAHGQIDRGTVIVAVDDYMTPEIKEVLVYTALRAGVAQVRASFLDATAQVEILISTP